MFAKLRKKLEEEEEKKHGELGKTIPRSPSLQMLAPGIGEISPKKEYDPSAHGCLPSGSSCENIASTSRKDTAPSISTPPKMNSVVQPLGSAGDSSPKNSLTRKEAEAKIMCDNEKTSKVRLEGNSPDVSELEELIMQSLKKQNENLQSQLIEMQSLLKRSSKSLSDQETSNIRHLLVKNQLELRECEALVKKKDELLKESQNRIAELEEEMKQLKLQLSNTSEKRQLKQLKEEKQSLEKEVDRLKQESLVTANRTSQLEKTLSELTDEHDALKHMHEVYKRKSGNIIEEKQSQLDHLQEKLALLEQRVQNSSLPDDDKFKALALERDGLEKKLDETVQHLNEIKSTWSEKINSLESQIFHLNKKIAEDNEDSSKLESEVRELRLKLKEKEDLLWKLEETIEEKDKELKNMKSSHDDEMNKLKYSSEKQEKVLNARIADLEQQLMDLTKEREKERQDAQLKLNELMSSQSDHIEKEIDMENRLSAAEDENRKLKMEWSKKEKECSGYLQSIATLKTASTDAQIRVTDLEHENLTLLKRRKSLELSIQDCQTELQRIYEEKGELLVRNAQLSQQLELIKQDLNQEQQLHNKDMEESAAELKKLREELQEMKATVSRLEQQASEYIESSARVLELKTLAAELEKNVAEKNKTIKLQQQRLNDMKKMLQKELKFQSGGDPLMASENSEPASLTLNKDFKPNSNVPSGKDFLNSKHITKISTLTQDDIGFQYLKHVMFKFMTSSEYEAQHLTKAVSVLLQFSPEEERLIRETLEWKTSWFGQKPQTHKLGRSGRHS